MDDKLFDILDDLNIRDTKLLLDEDIKLSLDSSTRKRIEKSIKKKTGCYRESNVNKEKINNILGGIFMKKKIALALSAAVILSLAGGGYAYAKTPVAYVSMDINPSVELGVNAFDTVVSVEAYNKDGEKILEGTDLVNTDVKAAVSAVISNAISEGYITQDVTTTSAVVVEITTSTDKESVATELNESLKEVAEVTLDNNDVDAEVETEKVALVRRDEARKLGITPGKLNLIQKLQQLDSAITIEDYKDSSVKDIQKKTKELRKNNKSQETTTEDSTSTDTKADVATDATADTVTEQATLSETSNDLEEAKIVEQEKNNNGNAKKEENNNVNSNSKKEENSNTNGNEEKKTTTTTTEKQNNSNNVKSQENSNSSKSENSSSSDSKGNSSNSNVLKASDSYNGNSSSENKGDNKNKN
ncbi:hypothetical protein psyc5s11_37290 [Clostridium gelidum]|uniref:Anti-sigma factor RsgI-like middle domain-containing protein n=1 Tax=Clostridium gelidum TaxID=704125 RepID=A0ABM7T8D2_9CLOT|nr:hypothetical protein [Clostridium gelidum]BCZ47662.1 hypothetical protein psyc5s11_37290 [Clostridium gelidum]